MLDCCSGAGRGPKLIRGTAIVTGAFSFWALDTEENRQLDTARIRKQTAFITFLPNKVVRAIVCAKQYRTNPRPAQLPPLAPWYQLNRTHSPYGEAIVPPACAVGKGALNKHDILD
jgi:hypothetical protein